MLVFLTKLTLMEYWVKYLALFCLFSVIVSFELSWMGCLHKNIQLMLEFFKAPFLIQHFSYYVLMTSLMTLSVILLSMLMKLLFALSVMWDLICGNNYGWLLNLNLIYETLWTGAGSRLLISIGEKPNLLVSFGQSNNSDAIDVKM